MTTSRKLPVELPPSAVVPIIDTREQNPVTLPGLAEPIRGTLATSDYSVLGWEHCIAVERKSAEDMLACIGRERERFDREVQRMLGYPVRALVIEADWDFFERGEWRGNVTSAAALGSLLGWITTGIPIVMAQDHDRAGQFIARILYTAARRRWREARALANGIDEQEASE